MGRAEALRAAGNRAILRRLSADLETGHLRRGEGTRGDDEEEA